MADSTLTGIVPVIDVGAGPVGLIAALNLARYGIRCKPIERNLLATKWPKIDLINRRTMELLGQMGFAERWRQIGKSIT